MIPKQNAIVPIAWRLPRSSDRRACSVGVIRDGEFVYKRSFGYASLELGVPLTPASVFYMASVSKQFTAASIVLAAEQGHLSLDDEVGKYLPELPNYGRRITLRQMLHQTSGFRDFLDLVFISGRNAEDLASPEEILKLIARQKGLNNVPGAEWVYSNSNYFLLGEIIRRATGKSLAHFAAENIFQPLGMTHTLFYENNKLVVPLAPDFKPTKNTVTAASDLPDPAAFGGTYLDPHTKTIYTSTADHGNLIAWGAVLRRIDANRFYDLGSNVITFEKVNGTMRCSLAIPGEVFFPATSWSLSISAKRS